jgi:two-component system, cell cycle response regulator
MDEPIEIIVGWCSSMEIPEFSLSSGLRLISIKSLDSIPVGLDLLVCDVQNFELWEIPPSVYSAIPVPKVILIDTLEQMSAILYWLERGDEICTREAIGPRLALHARERWRKAIESHFDPLLLDRQLQRLAWEDPITGIANRQKFYDYVTEWFLSSHHGDKSLCLILCDLDHFKHINDQFGHLVGDDILREIGKLFQESAFGAGLVARYGGEEFAICMPGNLDRGIALAEFLRARIEEQEFTEIRIRLTASFGVAVTSGESSFEELTREADYCVYAAKSRGRNRVVSDREANENADLDDSDRLIADFENRIQVIASRMASALTISARQIAKQYRNEADRDGLTGLFNRRYLDRLLAREWDKSRQQHRHLSLALIDLDRFGVINKTYGFPTGDRALKTAATIFQKNVRAGDWVARFGGEEFCVVMPDTDLPGACIVAERIRSALEASSVTAYNGQAFQITGSIGVVEQGENDSDLVAFWQRVSDRVQEAKQGGRNQIRF